MAELPSLDQHIGLRMSKRRRELKLTQVQLADALGLSVNQIRKYENGAKPPSAGALLRVAAHLQVSIGYFLDEVGGGLFAGDAPISPAACRWLRSPEGAGFVNRFCAIDPRVRASIVGVVGILDEADRDRGAPPIPRRRNGSARSARR